MKAIKDILITVGILLLICAFIYGCYWIAKTVSYQIFYKDMVRETITEMVKPEALK